jgi:hypothetical protein
MKQTDKEINKNEIDGLKAEVSRLTTELSTEKESHKFWFGNAMQYKTDSERYERERTEAKANEERIKGIFLSMQKNVKPCEECKNKKPGLSCGLPGIGLGEPVPCKWVNRHCLPDLPDRFEQKEQQPSPKPDLAAGHHYGICDTCKKEGDLTKLDATWLCPICFIYQIRGEKPEKCPACNGRGEIYEGDYHTYSASKCHTCNGTGKEPLGHQKIKKIDDTQYDGTF